MSGFKFLLAVLLLGSVAWSQESRMPANRSEPEQEQTRPERGMRPPWGGDSPREGWRGSGGRFGRDSVDPTEEEWDSAVHFMQRHSPHRWEFYLAAPEESRFRSHLRRRIVEQYRLLREIDEEDNQLAQLKIQQIEMEDEIFGLVRSRRDDEAVAGEWEPPQLRENVRALVDLQLEERSYRVSRLEQALEHEKSQLERDRRNVEELVDAQIGRWKRIWGPRGPESMRPHSDRPHPDRARRFDRQED